MTTEFSWQIESVDDVTHSMVITYTNLSTQEKLSLNIPKPLATAVLDTHVAIYAPLHAWATAISDFKIIEVGQSGTGTIVPPSNPT